MSGNHSSLSQLFMWTNISFSGWSVHWHGWPVDPHQHRYVGQVT